MPARAASGVLLVAKPAGVTSHDVVEPIRRAPVAAWREGRATPGTLDPFATGLLLVLVGQATRFQRFFMALPKAYRDRCALRRALRHRRPDRGRRGHGPARRRGRRSGGAAGADGRDRAARARSRRRSRSGASGSTARRAGASSSRRRCGACAVEPPRRCWASTRPPRRPSSRSSARAAPTCASSSPTSASCAGRAPTARRSSGRRSGRSASSRRTTERLIPLAEALSFLPERALDADEAAWRRNGRAWPIPAAREARATVRLTAGGELVAVAERRDDELKPVTVARPRPVRSAGCGPRSSLGASRAWCCRALYPVGRRSRGAGGGVRRRA